MSGPEPAIVVRDLRKTFLLRNAAIGSLKTLLVWWKRRDERRLEVLRGVSFEVAKGECVAIVGRNGAGKSTLLSLLARIYKPSGGVAQINGRVAPLLELGAGFHPDLS
ncbi:ATP-binding cassette domain-containing protein, partial [bacterium]